MTKFTNVIVRKPGNSLCNGITSAPELGQPIYERAVEEHDDYIAALKQCGVEVTELPALEEYPDSCFVEDPAVITRCGAIITNPGADSRNGEKDEIEPTIDTESQQLLLGIGATQEAQAERIESLANRHVDGLIVVPAAGTDLAGTLNQYANTLPIVQICGRQTAPRVSVVGIDENAAMEAIVKHLAEQGIASAAYMAGNELSFESAELFATFHTHMRTYGLATSENWNQFGERTVQRGFDCAMRLFNGPLVQPEAVVCADDAIAFGVMVAFDALGIRVPEDVLVVGYHDSAIARTTMPRLTSVRAPFERIVSECLRLLASGPAGGAAETAAAPGGSVRAPRVMLAPQLIVRDSSVFRR